MVNEKMKNWLFRQLPPLIWAFLIFLGSSLPAARVSENSLIDFLAHKVVHLFEYGLLYLLYYRSLVSDFWEMNASKVYKALLFIFLYAAFDEYHQYFIPGRNGRVQDVFVDGLGAVFALSLWWFLRQRMLHKHNV